MKRRTGLHLRFHLAQRRSIPAGRLFLTFLWAAATVSPLFGQFAPATHLGYNDWDSGDIVMTRVSVVTTTPSTYYETMGWDFGNNGAGYSGIQDPGSLGKNYLFSLWDPVSGGGTSVAVYSNPSGLIGRFCCEGTGVHYFNYTRPWVVNQWYRLVARAWDYKGQTYFALWSRDETSQTWMHQATLAFPAAGVRFTGPTVSFLEDFGSTGTNLRRVAYNDGWKRSTSGVWIPYVDAVFTETCNMGSGSQFCNAYDAGVQDAAYYLQAGGSTTPTLSPNAGLSLPFATTTPTLSTGRIVSASASYDAASNRITVSWTPDSTVSPQFSYNVDVFDNPGLAGSPVVSKSDVAPDDTSTVITPPSMLGNGPYYARVATTDIFDQTAQPVLAQLTTVSLASPIQLSPPNAASNVFPASTLTWSTSSGATSYDVYFGASFPPPFVANATGTSYNTGSLNQASAYHWRIVAKNGVGAASSDVWSFTTASCTQLAATGVSVSAVGGAGSLVVNASAECAWNAASNASWLTLTGSVSGSGAGSVAYSVAANTADRAHRRFAAIGGDRQD